MTDTVNTSDVSFFLVWTKNGRNPRWSHATYEAALAEAQRLALKYPDRRWFVVEGRTRVWVNEAADHLTVAEAGEQLVQGRHALEQAA